MFLAPDFFGGGSPEFLDLDYKIQIVSDHVAKFRGNRPRDFGERVAKGNKKAVLSQRYRAMRPIWCPENVHDS